MSEQDPAGGTPAAPQVPPAPPPTGPYAGPYSGPSYVVPPFHPGPAPQYAARPALPAYPGSTPPPPRRGGLPGWLWPVVAAIALVLGLVGGLVGGRISAGSGSGTAGVIKVQQRSAAPLPASNSSIPAVAAKVLPSTVQIIAEYDGDKEGATGSGFVLDSAGHILTNNHVVAEAAADHIPVIVIDHAGKRFKAKVVGRSAVYDVAVLEATAAKRLTPAALGSSNQMRVGETVVAIGSPLGLSATVTSGIISAVHRPVTVGSSSDSSFINAVQTDAAINPGNSGGPLVNLQGQVVGMNSAIASLGSTSDDGESGNIGVGFAIPIEQVQVTAEEILRTGKAVYPVIGADVRGLSSLDGARVESFTSGSPAAKAGLKVGDVIRDIDGKPVTSTVDLVVAIRSHVPGDKVVLTVTRDGSTRKVTVDLQGKTG